MSQAVADLLLFQQQLETCRKSLGRLLSGKAPLQTLTHLGKVYPLLENSAEYEWFCERVGLATFRVELRSLNAQVRLDPTMAFCYREAQVICTNPQCESTITVAAGDDSCPRCKNALVLAIFSHAPKTPEADTAAAPQQRLLAPVDCRGRSTSFWTFAMALPTAFIGGLITRRIFATSADNAIVAVGAIGSLLLYIVTFVIAAKRRGGITVEPTGISFRSSDKGERTTIAYSDIKTLKVEFVSGSNRYVRVAVFDSLGKMIPPLGNGFLEYTNDRFNRARTIALLQALAQAAPNVRLVTNLR